MESSLCQTMGWPAATVSVAGEKDIPPSFPRIWMVLAEPVPGLLGLEGDELLPQRVAASAGTAMKTMNAMNEREDLMVPP
jgi:hypothetical protein